MATPYEYLELLSEAEAEAEELLSRAAAESDPEKRARLETLAAPAQLVACWLAPRRGSAM